MRKSVKIAAILGLVIPSATIGLALDEPINVGDRKNEAWAIYFMNNAIPEYEVDAASAAFYAAHPELERSSVTQIVFTGSLATLTHYFALFGPGWLRRRRSHASGRSTLDA